ncbi:TFIIB-type zinc ribbon-containing protein [Haloterrigena sp. SYSU A121-1]|uniref:TFIIB-type zinc ribbon-containing protein n=1 Tax=Haloterrigena gelatinilytica TaxID=2741724 RepID=A0A8J8KHI7_9EURY|nr:TFIIB-type zinc ribbon-containing protein [Haloterrigena gelatinilytica]NUB91184.1 TFIIB-type zinc ribbon-containing protein [Haloterrigena gelatinilytica]
MRIETQLSEDDSDLVQKLADRRGLQKDRAYTELIRTGVDVGMRRERVKELIVEFFEDEKERHDRRMAALRDEYEIDEVEHVDEYQFYVVCNGIKYSFGSPDDLRFVNGESVDRSLCPECGSEDIEFDADAMDTDGTYWTCGDCGHAFDRADRKGVPDEDEADRVVEFVRRRQDLFEYVVGQLTALLDGVMCAYGGQSHTEWLGPGGFMYSNGFQRVDIPFWTTDTEQIRFRVNDYTAEYESLRNPLYPAAVNRLTADYLALVREIEAVNPDADRVEPIFIDRRGRKPEIIEVVGRKYDETRLPLHTVGYEVEKVEPSMDDLEPEYDAEEDGPVTWIRITNDKVIEQEGDS